MANLPGEGKGKATGGTGKGWSDFPEFAGDKTDDQVGGETENQIEVELNADNNVYREIAEHALMNWNGLSEEDAAGKVAGASVEELEGQVWAGDSIKAAVEGIGKVLSERGVDWKGQEDLLESILNGEKQDAAFSDLGDKIKEALENGEDYTVADLAVEVLGHIHTDWIEHNVKKFSDPARENRRYQFAPVELIGFKEAMADNLFLAPVIAATGVEMPSQEELEAAYDRRRDQFGEKWHLQADVINGDAEPTNGQYSSRSELVQTMFAANFPDNQVPDELKSIQDALGDAETANRVLSQVAEKSAGMNFAE